MKSKNNINCNNNAELWMSQQNNKIYSNKFYFIFHSLCYEYPMIYQGILCHSFYTRILIFYHLPAYPERKMDDLYFAFSLTMEVRRKCLLTLMQFRYNNKEQRTKDIQKIVHSGIIICRVELIDLSISNLY